MKATLFATFRMGQPNRNGAQGVAFCPESKAVSSNYRLAQEFFVRNHTSIYQQLITYSNFLPLPFAFDFTRQAPTASCGQNIFNSWLFHLASHIFVL